MTQANVNSGLTLVTGGTGKTGRRVADRLRAMNRPVRIGSRDFSDYVRRTAATDVWSR